jgi:hypothetical protein
MPKNIDDIEQEDSPITPPEDDKEEQAMTIPETTETPEPVPEIPDPVPGVPDPEPSEPSGSKWGWIGAPDHPDAQEHEDGISDLFEIDSDDDTSDLISVDLEKDIVDGNLDDLTEVSEEDIMGDEETGQVPLDYKPDPPRRRSLPKYRRMSRWYVPPTSTRGLG